MKKLLAAVSVTFGLAGVLILHPSKTLDSGEPQPAGNSNCTYANGIVRLCPASMLYNKNMPEPTQSTATAATVNQYPIEPSPAPVTTDSESTSPATSTPEPIVTTSGGVTSVDAPSGYSVRVGAGSGTTVVPTP